MIHYEFCMRYRHHNESEGLGSLLFRFTAADGHVSSIVRRMALDVAHQYPAALFDGMIYYGSHDT
jgi:hypothetical protein